MAPRGNFVGLAILAIAVIVAGRALDDYTLGVLVFAGLYALNALGLSLLTGFAGQVSIGQAAFFGAGAYTLGILTTRTAVPLPVAWIVAIGAAMLLAVAVGLPSLRLRGHYLAMATLAFGEIFYIVINADPAGLTGGPSGFGRIPRLSLGPWVIRGEQAYFYVCWALVWIAILVGINIVHSRTGRALRALHISESAARSLGVNTGRLKIQVFVLSALLSAVAGCLYAHFVTFLSPTGFSLIYSIRFITMAAIGGMANLWGAVAGATFLALLPEQLRFLHDYEALVYGGILMVLMIYCPSGILGWIRPPPALRKRMHAARGPDVRGPHPAGGGPE